MGRPAESMSLGTVVVRAIIRPVPASRQDQSLIVLCSFIDPFGVKEGFEGSFQRLAVRCGAKNVEHWFEERIMDPGLCIVKGKHLQAICQDGKVLDRASDAIASDVFSKANIGQEPGCVRILP